LYYNVGPYARHYSTMRISALLEMKKKKEECVDKGYGSEIV